MSKNINGIDIENTNLFVANAPNAASNPAFTKDIATPATPTIYNVTMTTLNTEYPPQS